MSHGLGRMQRTILECLEPAKRAHAEDRLRSIGGAGLGNEGRRDPRRPPMVHRRGRHVVRRDGESDLRAALVCAAMRDGQGHGSERNYSVAFDVRPAPGSLPSARRSRCSAAGSCNAAPGELSGDELRFVSRRPSVAT